MSFVLLRARKGKKRFTWWVFSHRAAGSLVKNIRNSQAHFLQRKLASNQVLFLSYCSAFITVPLAFSENEKTSYYMCADVNHSRRTNYLFDTNVTNRQTKGDVEASNRNDI